MAIDQRNLSGARASSAVRCMARAEYEGLHAEPTNETPAFLERAFKRGVNVGKAWAASMRGAMPNAILEAEVPWGPPEWGWTGHADVLDPDTKTVYETYHAAGGAFREEKALQAAFYAYSLGPEYKAELAVVDTTDVHDEDGFAVQPYEINVAGLIDRVMDIQARVVTAVALGEVNPADKVGDSPMHSECRSCPFQQACWRDWRPTPPEEVTGLEDSFQALLIADGDYKAAEAKVASTKQIRDQLRQEVREYLTPGIPVLSGDVIAKVIEVKGRTSVKLADYLKAGFDVPAELAPFVSESKPSERWFIDKASHDSSL